MKRIVIIVVVTVLAFIGFKYLFQASSVSDTESENGAEGDYLNIPLTESQMKTAGIALGQAEDRDINMTLTVSGQIVLRAKDKGDVTSLTAGVVKQIFVTDGQYVSKGQTVAMVENTEAVSLQRDYYSASKDCEFARIELERQRTLDSGGAGIRRNLEQAEKEYRVAQARMQGVAQQLEQMGIGVNNAASGKFVTAFPVKAPIAGTVCDITASLGSYADMQTPLMAVHNNGAAECDLNVYEKDLHKVKVGDKVELSITNEPGKKIAGQVYGMNQYFTDGTKAVAVHVRLLPHDCDLFDGEYVNGAIDIGSQRGQTLPSNAIIRIDGKNYIFALNGKPDDSGYHFSRHEVAAGASDGGYTAVALCKHIKRGQKIVTANAFYLASLIGDHGEE